MKKELREKLRSKLKEKSTWVGLGVLLAAFGVPVVPGAPEAVGSLVIAALGAYEIFRKEDK